MNAVGFILIVNLPACSKKSGDAVVFEKEHIAATEIHETPNEQKPGTPATAPAGAAEPAEKDESDEAKELGPNEIVVDGYVMDKELRGTSRDPRALPEAQWLVRVRLVSGRRRIEIDAEQARYDKLNPGDRGHITYREGKYTGTV